MYLTNETFCPNRPSDDRTEPIWLFLLSVIETCAQRLGSVLAVGGSTNFALGLEILFSAGNLAYHDQHDN